MVFVDPVTGKRYAEEADYLTDEPRSLSALTGQFEVTYGTGGLFVRADETNPLGNSVAGTFVINGTGKKGDEPSTDTLVSQTYVESAAGAVLLARVQAFLSSNFGFNFAAQYTSTSPNPRVITGLPGAIRIGASDWWGAGQQWQRVHPAFRNTSNDSTLVPAGDEGDPPYSRLGWQWDFYRPDADPVWLRWLTFGRSEHTNTNFTQWPLFQFNSSDDPAMTVYVTDDQSEAYTRCLTHDGEGFTSSSAATAALGLTSPGGDGRHFGNDKGFPGMDRVDLSDFYDDVKVVQLGTLNWDEVKPWRWQLWTNSAEANSLTGTDWATSIHTHLVADVEVYPPAAVGPEIPAGIETLVAETLPRVTSRIRLRTGIDGGSP